MTDKKTAVQLISTIFPKFNLKDIRQDLDFANSKKFSKKGNLC